MMRGYRFLKVSNQLGKITAVKEALTNTRLNQCTRRASRRIFGAGLQDAELAIRQYLLIRVGGPNLNKALLYALGKPGSDVVHPVPPEWRQIVEQHGFKVAKIRSALAWNGFVALLLAYGLVLIARQLAGSVKEIIRPSFRALGRFAYFGALAAGNLPQPCKDGRSHDIVTWYRLWSGRVGELDTLCHSVAGVAPSAVDGMPVIPVPSAIPPLTHIGALARFIGWSAASSARAIFDLLRGRWWHALMLGEASLAATIRMHEPDSVARDYLFHNSGWIYRPLWTYEAEKHGSRITFYFYSTNCESFKRPDGYPALTYGWQAMNWPHYLVWDEYQSDFIRRAVGKGSHISVVGPIWFQSSAVEMPQLNKPGVVVFDITPHRPSRYCLLGADYEFYVPATSEGFLEHIADAAHRMDAVMLWKRKRKIGNIAHPRYRHFADRLPKRGDIVLVDPDVAAVRAIEGSCAVISMPFTSTALIARELGKPSIYYDPTGQLQSDDRAAHGIPIISGPERLEAWLCSHVNFQLKMAHL
ncbi:MAG: polysaccharide biosynthesis PFTS motif protein [Nitrospiraceae bacterium]